MRRFLFSHVVVAFRLLVFWHLLFFAQSLSHFPLPLPWSVVFAIIGLLLVSFFSAAWWALRPSFRSRVSLALVSAVSSILVSWVFFPASMFITTHLSPFVRAS